VDSRSWTRLVTGVALGICLAALLCVIVYKIRLVFVPFGAGFVVAYIFDPWLDRLEARGWSRQRAVWTVMGLILAVLALLLVVLVPRVVQEAGDAWDNRKLYGERVDDTYRRTLAKAEGWLAPYLPELGTDEHVNDRRERVPGSADAPYLPQTSIGQYIDDQLKKVPGWADEHKGQIAGWIGDRILQAIGMLFLVLFGTLVAFHFMLIIDPLRQGVEAVLFSPQQSEQVDAVVQRVNRMLGSYVRGLVAVSALVALTTGIVLWILGSYFGSRYALMIGLLAGATYAVPWLGQTASAVAAFLAGIATADHHSLVAGLVSGLAVIGVNQVFDNLVMPRIVGRQVGLHPLAVLFALMAGFQLWGLVGLIVAVPVAAAIRIALQRWVPTIPEDEEEEPRGLPRLDIVRLGRSIGEALRRFRAPAAEPLDEDRDQT
jgi:predicted PurR-regulated permease PerM